MPRIAVNPESLPTPPTFSRAVAVSGPGRTIYVAGIGPTDDRGDVDRPGDLARQAEVCFAKLAVILDAAGASTDDVVSLTIYVTDISQIAAVHGARARYLSGPILPATSGMEVSALAHPDWMIEIDGVAFAEG